jgi:hypothetical protein
MAEGFHAAERNLKPRIADRAAPGDWRAKFDVGRNECAPAGTWHENSVPRRISACQRP